MSQARVTQIKSSLASKMERPGGRTVRELTRRADEAVEQYRERVMAMISEHLVSLGQLCAQADEVAAVQIYAVASGIVDVAGYYDTGPLYEAAYSLCDTVDRMLSAASWNWPSVEVHHRALVLILADGCRTGRASETLLDGLRAVARKTGA